MTLGKYPQLSLQDARRQYYDLYEQVNDYGRDPVQEAKEKVERQNSGPRSQRLLKLILTS